MFTAKFGGMGIIVLAIEYISSPLLLPPRLMLQKRYTVKYIGSPYDPATGLLYTVVQNVTVDYEI